MLMNPDIKALWTTALRSGKYPQGIGRLNSNNRFCCLGVLCELAVEAKVCEKEEYRSAYATYSGHGGLLPKSVEEWAGLTASTPTIDEVTLTYYNDSLKFTFNQIADLIEKHL